MGYKESECGPASVELSQACLVATAFAARVSNIIRERSRS